MARSSFGNLDPWMEMVSMLGQHVLNSSSSANEEFTSVDELWNSEKWNSLREFGSIHDSLVQFPPYRESVSLSTSNRESCLNRFLGISVKSYLERSEFLERSRYRRVLMLKTSSSKLFILHCLRLRLVRLGRFANAPGLSSRGWLKVEIIILSCQRTKYCLKQCKIIKECDL